MLFEISLALFSLIIIIIIFQFCKCNKIEKFESDSNLQQQMKRLDLKKQLMTNTEEFITQDDISQLEESTLQMLSGIQNIKNKLKKTEVNEEIDESLLTELHDTINEEDSDDEEEIIEDDDEDNDDIVEGFMEKSTHNCHSFK